MLTREEILAQAVTGRERVAVPEWGDGAEVYVAELTAAEVEKLVGDTQDGECECTMAIVAVRTVVDESGERVFRDEDVEAVSGLSGAALTRIMAVASDLNKIGADSVEDLEKN